MRSTTCSSRTRRCAFRHTGLLFIVGCRDENGVDCGDAFVVNVAAQLQRVAILRHLACVLRQIGTRGVGRMCEFWVADDGVGISEEHAARIFDRYFQAFPTLKNGAQKALAPETEVPVGGSVTGTIMVAFPIALDAFNQRQSVSVVIWPYNETVPVTLTK